MPATKIEVLGTGCMKCAQLAENVREAVAQAGIDAEIVKIEDLMEITSRGVLMTPALTIDGVVKSSGKLLSVEEVCALINAGS